MPISDPAPLRGGPPVPDSLSFPDAPRLELDQLLVQLTERADDVLATQGRLRGLLRANALIAADLTLPVVLRQIVEAARDLLGARYAALGVLGRDGELEQFVHTGMDDDLVTRIGDLPRGRGILGLLMSEPVPIRLPDLAAHSASAGFPPGQPPMTGFIGVPIRIGEEIFGNLYLTERTQGAFTAEDEELAIALAATAGAAIANARRFTESEQRRRWLAASSELTRLLLSGAAQPHTLITQHAAVAAEADFATLAVPHGTGQVMVTAVSGTLAAGMMNRAAPLEDSLAGQAILTGKASLVTDYRREATALALGADIGPLIVVPLPAGEQIHGALILGRLASNPGFTETHLSMAASFAGQAAMALEVAQARADQVVLAQVEDHDRIASDLHDHAIQELFALGMRLQGMAERSGQATADQVNRHIDTIDEVINKIRTSIFGLRQPRHQPGDLTARLVELARERTSQLGFTPGLRFAGPLDLTVTTAVADDILAVTREAMSNCARHAQATAISVSLTLDAGLITLGITDNGRGSGVAARSSAVSGMRHRAERNGGTLEFSTPAGGGTELAWTARLDRLPGQKSHPDASSCPGGVCRGEAGQFLAELPQPAGGRVVAGGRCWLALLVLDVVAACCAC